MEIAVRHRLAVNVGEGVPRAVMHLLLTPQSSNAQTVKEWRVDAPGMDDAGGFIDAYGNRAHLATQTRPEAELMVTAAGVVITHDRNGVVGKLEREPVPVFFTRRTPLTKPMGAIVSRLLSASKVGADRIALLHALMARTAEALEEPPARQSQDGQLQDQVQSMATERPPPAAADYAHAFIGAARALDIPARYVTGYLYADGDVAPGFHAWAEAWDDGLGWIAFDALLGRCPTDRHVRLACGLDAATTPAVRAVPMVGTPQSLGVEVSGGQ